jgi:alkylated DNA repair dioxygenase AlkB
MQEIRARVESLCGQRFNCVLLNLYRDGHDSMGWHSDDEPELGPDPFIASVSLGTPRRFLLRSRAEPVRTHEYLLGDGSLLLMEPPLQAAWKHALPRSRRVTGVRLNLTWRFIEPSRS